MPDSVIGESTREFDAVVVGAGFGGLYMLHRLRALGLSTRLYEAGDDVGGAWYWNRYPGARCDIEAADYSYSFSPELEQEWEWSETYASQPEMLRYLNHVVDRFDLRRDITFGARVTNADYSETTGRWRIRTDTGQTALCRFFIMATGCLSVPMELEIPGLDSFQGEVYQTAQWPQEGVTFQGKRVGFVGTGSSGVQCIPRIAEQVSSLAVFQRTPVFTMPSPNRPLSAQERSEIKSWYRQRRAQARESWAGVLIGPVTRFAPEFDHEERTRTYWETYRKGLVGGIISSYSDVLTDKAANDTVADFLRDRIRDVVHDPDVAEALCPTSYPVGTKRPCLDFGYHETFNLPHVSLVDLRETPLLAITPRGIRTTDREYELDSIVLATGFDAMTGAVRAVDIRGRGGAALRDKWADGPVNYLGLCVAGFPNLFMISGPGSPSVLVNGVLAGESHADWIAECIAHLEKQGASAIEALPEAETEWWERAGEIAGMTLFPSTDSWYTGANVPGKKRVFMPFAGGFQLYQQMCGEVVADGYRGFTVIPAR
jgi:cyclohexanone monooxygenase